MLSRGLQASAMTYFPAGQYHRRPRLNCCVRDGNRCDPWPMVTDKDRIWVSSDPVEIDRKVERLIMNRPA